MSFLLGTPFFRGSVCFTEGTPPNGNSHYQDFCIFWFGDHFPLLLGAPIQSLAMAPRVFTRHQCFKKSFVQSPSWHFETSYILKHGGGFKQICIYIYIIYIYIYIFFFAPKISEMILLINIFQGG